ncbi:MAG: hypothetical protein FWG35_01025 [Spirochaetaceae bacterium]|nr:hypothetical protein [Spirochaetaceae bacterium]
MSLADLSEDALVQCLETIDSRDLVLGIRHLEPRDQRSILDRISSILGMDYAEILKLGVLQEY